MQASTRVSALGPFVSKPYDSRYSTRKSCPTQRKDGKSRKRICLSRYDWSAWMLSWLGAPSKSFKLWFQHNLKSHKTKLSYANAKQPRCLSNPFYWTNYDIDQRLTGFLISKSIELQWAMPRHPVLLPQPPIVLKPWCRVWSSGASTTIIKYSKYPTFNISDHTQTFAKKLKRVGFETRVTTKILENDWASQLVWCELLLPLLLIFRLGPSLCCQSCFTTGQGTTMKRVWAVAWHQISFQPRQCWESVDVAFHFIDPPCIKSGSAHHLRCKTPCIHSTVESAETCGAWNPPHLAMPNITIFFSAQELWNDQTNMSMSQPTYHRKISSSGQVCPASNAIRSAKPPKLDMESHVTKLLVKMLQCGPCGWGLFEFQAGREIIATSRILRRERDTGRHKERPRKLVFCRPHKRLRQFRKTRYESAKMLHYA